MKKTILFVTALSLVAAMTTSPVFAKERRKNAPAANPSNEAPITMSSSAASEAGATGGRTRVGLGVTTFNSLGNNGGLSAWVDFNDRHSLQVVLGVNSTSPAFTFGTGLGYRLTLSGNQMTGFHLGAIVNLGMVPSGAAGAGTDFAIALSPAGGFHYTMNEAPVMFSFDAGPAFSLVDGTFNFAMAPLSNQFLGFSAHYFF